MFFFWQVSYPVKYVIGPKAYQKSSKKQNRMASEKSDESVNSKPDFTAAEKTFKIQWLKYVWHKCCGYCSIICLHVDLVGWTQ